MAKRVVEKEQYFTPPQLASRCLDLLERHFQIDSFNTVIEPSAGGGSFYSQLPAQTRIGIDLEPLHKDLVKGDFLEWLPALNAGRTITVGNPPFGQRAAVAMRFITHAAKFSDVIAFILPRSFNKYTFQNRMPANFHLVDAMEVSEFELPDGKPVSVKAVFQIWEKRTEIRQSLNYPNSHPDFEMKHAHLSRTSPELLKQLRETYDFTIPQVGENFKTRPVSEVSRGSHWFIKANSEMVRERFDRLDFAFLNDMNTAHKSLSKRDIIFAYETLCETYAK